MTGEGAVATHSAAHDLARPHPARCHRDDQAVGVVEKLQAEVKRLHKEVSELKVQAAMGGAAASQRRQRRGRGRPDGDARRSAGSTRTACAACRTRCATRSARGVVVLAQRRGTRSRWSSRSPRTSPRASRPAPSSSQIAPIVGGGGGGRPDFAEAGGKDVSKIDALPGVHAVVERVLTTAGAGDRASGHEVGARVFCQGWSPGVPGVETGRRHTRWSDRPR